ARIPDEPYSALGLVLRRRQRAKHGEHRVQVRQTRSEAIHEITEREVALQQIIVVILDVIGEVAHQCGMHLLEPPQRLAAGVDDVLVARLPALELRALAGPLLAIDLEQLPRDLELLPLDLQDLAL